MRPDAKQVGSLEPLPWENDRFYEWARATWNLQKANLDGNNAMVWKFTAYWNPDDCQSMCEEAKTWIAGTMMSVRPSGRSQLSSPYPQAFCSKEFWDSCAEAGAKQRPSSMLEGTKPDLKVLRLAGDKVEQLGKSRVRLFDEWLPGCRKT